jgi:hypothetical protein
MQDPNQNQGDNLIRITMEDATSAHVEDLLRRQMSLRGEQGVARDQRKWYYQNWIIFMISGALAAFAAWAVIEPRFEDNPYVQGQITEIHPDEEMPEYIPGADEKGVQWRIGGHGRIQIGDDSIWIADDAREWGPKGAGAIVNVESLKVGQEIGVYAEYHAVAGNAISLGRFIVLSPKPWPPGEQHLDIPRLKARTNAMGMLLFPLVAGFIGLALGAADGAVCRHLRRALLSGLIGFFVGLVGGFISGILGDLVYAPLNHLALAQLGSSDGGFTPLAFLLQMIGRSFAWALAGMAMGLGQGIALRSVRLLLYGLIGGLIGGLFGGLFFDPIDILLLGPDKPSAWISRLVGLLVIGGSVGATIGLVELLARDAWLRMVEGPLAGKEFLLFKDIMNVGASPRSDIYLFNDPQVAQQHAMLRLVGEDCEIEAKNQQTLVMLNNRIVSSSRLRHGDRIAIGRTVFVFQTRKT